MEIRKDLKKEIDLFAKKLERAWDRLWVKFVMTIRQELDGSLKEIDWVMYKRVD